jgi:hypothetical protein
MLRLARALDRAGPPREPLDEPADDQRDHHLDPDLEGDVRPLVALVEVCERSAS